DDHVVHVALAQPLARDADELGVLPELVDGVAAGVPHPRAQAADQLDHDRRQRAPVGNAPFDAFGDELLVRRAALAIAILAAALHRTERPHPAVDLVAAPLVEHELAGGFVSTGEQGSTHHARGACRDGLGDFTGVLDAAVGDHRHARALGHASAVGDRRDLRHADAGDDAGRADAAGADADLDR